MTEIMQALTTRKKTNEVTRKQVLAWLRHVEAQRAQKTIIQATKESNEFNAMKMKEQKSNSFNKTKGSRRETCNN